MGGRVGVRTGGGGEAAAAAEPRQRRGALEARSSSLYRCTMPALTSWPATDTQAAASRRHSRSACILAAAHAQNGMICSRPSWSAEWGVPML